MFWLDTDAGIRHADPEGPRRISIRLGGDADNNLALFGELDRVIDEIDRDLTELGRITDHELGNTACDVADQFDVLFLGLACEHLCDALEDVMHIRDNMLGLHLPCLDL